MSIATLADVRSWLGLSSPYDSNDTFIINVLLAAVDRLFADFLGYSVAQAERTEYYPMRANLTQRDNLVDGWERAGGNKVVPVDRYRAERRILGLRHLPVRSVASVYEDMDAWLSKPPVFSTLLEQGSDYALDCDEDGLSRTGFLIRNTGPWSVAERCLKVTYTAGYSESELGAAYASLKWAFLTQCQVAFNAVKIHRLGAGLGAGVGILVSESLGDWSASYDAATNAKLYGLDQRLAPGVMKALEPYVNYTAFVF